MTEPALPWDGGCLCGQVRLKISAPPLLTMACHCRSCQRLASSAFSLSVLVPSDGFEITKGEPVIGALHGPNRHFYCPNCMSWMFNRADGLDAFVIVRSTMLDQAAGLTPYIETATGEKLHWATTPAVRSFEGFPAPEDYGPLLEAYAAQAARTAR